MSYCVLGLSHIGWVCYTSSSVHTGGPNSKGFPRMDVMQNQFLQLCCSHSVHRVSIHDAACLYGVAVYVEQRPRCNCAVSTASTKCQLMMRHVYMASPYVSRSAHIGAPSSKALTIMDVMQKQFFQVCCSHSVHRVSAHDATCLYGIAVCVVQHPHWGTQFKSIGSNRCQATTILAIVLFCSVHRASVI